MLRRDASGRLRVGCLIRRDLGSSRARRDENDSPFGCVEPGSGTRCPLHDPDSLLVAVLASTVSPRSAASSGTSVYLRLNALSWPRLCLPSIRPVEASSPTDRGRA